jgi:inorganic triphosphatase YgiF
MSDPVRETELKFEIGPQAEQALRSHPAIAAAPTATRLRSTYFDTPHHRLLDRGMVLRVREADSRFVQTVKRGRGPGGIDRDEWETEVASARPDLAALKATPAAQALDGEDACLEPLFETSVNRISALWSRDGDLVEVSLDEGEVSGGGRREPIRELELELKSGRVEALFALARELSSQAPLRLSYDAKSTRGYRLIGRQEPGSAAEPEVVPGQSTAEAFRAIARAALGQIASAAAVLQRAPDARALHQTRVALRRFRAALSLFRPLLLGRGYETVRGEARRLAKALDAARDLDVFIQGALEPAEAEAAGKGLKALRRGLEKARKAAYAEALEAVSSRRFCDFLLDAAEWIEVGAWRRARGEPQRMLREQPVEAFAAQALDRLRRRVVRRGKGLKGQPPAERHELRIACKKLRYAGELLGGAFGEAAETRRRDFLAAARRMQDALGVLNDIAVAEATAARAAAGASEAAAFAAGRLVGRREGEAAGQIKAAAKAFRGLKHAKPFWR